VRLGKQLLGGEVIELISDLGGGKTTFTRGLARGAGSNGQVASPTFTISREYLVKGETFHKLLHFDFYRLHEGGIIAHELTEVLDDPKNVVVVEWADAVRHVLPAKRLSIKFITKGQDSRELQFSYPDSLQYLLEGLK
jgi:tRNA threonylcarbamoyladenosine biosynthesis protein TsaE